MRTIKFRGKRCDTGEWVVGFYTENSPWMSGNVIECEHDDYQVIPESVGQWTGMYDKKGFEIYEDDVVEAWDRGLTAKGVVAKRVDGLYYMHPATQHGKLWGLCPIYTGETTVTIIGNVVDDPELMEVE